MRFIAAQSNGDVRYALNLLELASVLCEDGHVTRALLDHCQMVPNQRTSKEGDGHYDLLSAFQKSIRGSDVDAALYYLALFLDTNDLESLERRLLVIAYEDIGWAIRPRSPGRSRPSMPQNASACRKPASH